MVISMDAYTSVVTNNFAIHFGCLWSSLVTTLSNHLLRNGFVYQTRKEVNLQLGSQVSVKAIMRNDFNEYLLFISQDIFITLFPMFRYLFLSIFCAVDFAIRNTLKEDKYPEHFLEYFGLLANLPPLIQIA